MEKTNLGLVKFCQRALGEKWGYVWGTFGRVLTADQLNQKIKQYPGQVGTQQAFIKANWLGRRTADCVGLIKAYIWWDEARDNPAYNAAQDHNCDVMFNRCAEKGAIATIPEIPGLLVWKSGHIGVYIGGGEVIEAKGTRFGVVKTPLKGADSSNWTHWGKCAYIAYKQPEKPQLELDLEVLQGAGIIKSPAYWRASAVPGGSVKGEYAAELIRNFAEYVKKRG